MDTSAPKDYDGLMKWEPWIKKIGFQLGVPPHELDDFFSQILLDFLTGGYLEKYDSNIAAWTTYLHAFVRLRAMRDRDKHSRSSKPLTEAPLADEIDEDDSGSLSISVPDPKDLFESSEYDSRMETILDDLKATSPILEITRRVVVKNGQRFTFTIHRSLYTLAIMLLSGYTQREIATIYDRSQGTVANMVKSLRKHPAIVSAVLDIHPSGNLLRRR